MPESRSARSQRPATRHFEHLIVAYLADISQDVKRPWGIVPKVESWENYQSCLKGPRLRWGHLQASDVTDDLIAELYKEMKARRPMRTGF